MNNGLKVLTAAVAFLAATPDSVESAKIGWPTPEDVCREMRGEILDDVEEAMTTKIFGCYPNQPSGPAIPVDHSVRAIEFGKIARDRVEEEFPRPTRRHEKTLHVFVQKCADKTAAAVARLIMQTDVQCKDGEPVIWK